MNNCSQVSHFVFFLRVCFEHVFKVFDQVCILKFSNPAVEQPVTPPDVVAAMSCNVMDTSPTIFFLLTYSMTEYMVVDIFAS